MNIPLLKVLSIAGLIHTQQGQLKDAIKMFEEVLQIEKHNESAQKFLKRLKELAN